MRDEQGFRRFASARAEGLRRQALLLTGQPRRAAELAERALGDTARRWDRLAGPTAAEEHARTVLARAALRRTSRMSPTPNPPAPTIGPAAPATAAGGTAGVGAASAGRPAGRAVPGSRRRGAATSAVAQPPAEAAAPGRAVAGTGRGGAATAQDGTGPATREPPPAATGRSDGTAGGGDAGDAEAVWRALASLPPRRRAVLVLRYDEGLDDAAVAARLGVPSAAVAADGEAGLGALRSILRRRGRPEDLLPAALADPAHDLPVPAGATATSRPARPPRRRRLLVAGAAAAVLAVGAAILLPVMRSDSAPVPATTSVGEGQLAWPARGSLAGDEDLLRSALHAWQDAVPEAQRPADTSVLYAGHPDGSRIVLLQGTDPAGLAWVALVGGGGGDDATPLELVRTEPLGRTAPVLALWGAERRVRLLGPPDRDGGLLVRGAGGAPADPLRRLAVEADGVTEQVSLAGGTLPVVVLRGGPEPGVVGSGQVTADRLTAPGGEVELGTSPLPGGGSIDVRLAWYEDGRQLARQLRGAVIVAPVGPVLATSVDVRGRSRPVEVRGYEVRQAGISWFGTVIRVDGTPACVDVLQLGAAAAASPRPAAVRRCMPAGARDGVVHVVADAPVASVRVRLGPRRGQRERTVTVTAATAGARFAGGGFAALVRVGGMPTGAGGVVALDAAGRPLSRFGLRPYVVPRS